MKVETKFVSPVMAEHMLKTMGPNRPVATSRVMTLANEMRLGKWQLNGETIIVSDTGRLLDGQHRLLAIIESGCTVQLAIASDVPEESFQTIDTGKARSHGDIGAMAGVVRPKASMAAANMVWRLWHHTGVTEVCPPAFALEVVNRFPAIQKWASFVKAKPSRNVVPAGSLLTGLVYLEDVAKMPHRAEQFFAGIDSGADLSDGSPILTLRQRMINMRASGQIMTAATCWNSVARALTAVEEGELLYKIQAETSSGRIRRPKGWAENVKRLPKSMSLDDLTPPDQEGGTTRQRVSDYLRDLRGDESQASATA